MQFHSSLTGRALLVLALACGVLPTWAAPATTPEARAREHLVRFPAHTLHGPQHSYQLRDVVVDPDGAEHVRFDRRYKGLRVLGGDLVVHSDRAGRFTSASLTLRRWLDLPVKPLVHAGMAVRMALQSHPGDTRQLQPELVVYARNDLPTLAWDVQVFGEQADGTPSEKHVLVDAYGGQLLDVWDDIHTSALDGSGKGFFNRDVVLTTDWINGRYELRDPGRGNQSTNNMANKTAGSGAVFTDTDNRWGNYLLSDVATVGVTRSTARP